jgi:hypothetical protein
MREKIELLREELLGLQLAHPFNLQPWEPDPVLPHWKPVLKLYA